VRSRARRVKITFARKLMLSYLALVCVTAATIGSYAYTVTLQSSMETATNNARRSLQQIREGVTYQIRDAERVSNQLFNSYNFQRLLQSTNEDYAMYELMKENLLPVLDSALSKAVVPITLSLYVENPRISEIYDPESLQDPNFQDRIVHVFQMGRIREAPWFQELESSRELHLELKNTWRSVDTDRAFGNVSLLRKLISFDSFAKQLGFLRVTVKLRNLFSSVHSIENEPYASVLVVGDRGEEVLYASRNVPEGVDWPHIDRSRYLVLEEPLPGTEWRLVGIVPYASLRQNAEKIRTITLAVCLASVLVVILIGWGISRYFSRRVGKIVGHMHYFQEGDFGRRIRMPGEDEFAEIASAFNGMAQHTEDLIQRVYVSGLRQKESELVALQNQINPHFLYNTLSSINSLAMMGEAGKVGEMVTQLAKYYRLTLNEGNTFITVDKELQQAMAYIDIQRIKYRDTLEVSYDIDERTLPCTTVKLILQPFVENVLKHAWFGDKIHVRITAQLEGGDIVFKVIDNGAGMSREAAERLLDEDRPTGGYGVRNVHLRIRLQYGEPYGVSVYSRPGIGTTVRIVVPAEEAQRQPR